MKRVGGQLGSTPVARVPNIFKKAENFSALSVAKIGGRVICLAEIDPQGGQFVWGGEPHSEGLDMEGGSGVRT